MEKGRVCHSPLFLLRVRIIAPIEMQTRIATVVPVKVAKKAVLRNRLRRVMYEAIHPMYVNVKAGQHVIVFAKAAALKATFAEIEKEMKEIFVKAGLLR
jgi:ribonuclease P protein component